MKFYFFAFISLFLFASCQKTEISDIKSVSEATASKVNKESTRSSFDSSSDVTVDNVGQWHNYCLDNMIDYVDRTVPFDSPEPLIISFANSVSEIVVEQGVFESTNLSINEGYESFVNDDFNSYCNTIYSAVETGLEDIGITDDVEAFADLKVILNKDYSAPENLEIDIKDELLTLKGNYLGDNELIIGALNVGISSAEYWQDFSAVGPNGDPVLYDANIVAMDAGGYIVGWAKAWLIDQLQTPKERIKAGLGFGAASSGMGLFKKWGLF